MEMFLTNGLLADRTMMFSHFLKLHLFQIIIAPGNPLNGAEDEMKVSSRADGYQDVSCLKTLKAVGAKNARET